MRRTILVLTVALASGSCSTTPAITMVGDGGVIAGVPVRIKTEYIVHVFQRNPEKLESATDYFTEVASSHQVLADQQRLFAIDVTSAPFGSPGLNVQEYADNSLKSIEVTSTQNQSGAIDAVSTALTGVTTAQNQRAAACQTSNSAALQSDQALASARSSYDGLPASATPQLRAAYQQVIASAQASADFAHSAPPCH
jgi:hypothetical protein